MRRGVVIGAIVACGCAEPPSEYDGGQTGEEQLAPCLDTAVAIGFDESPDSLGYSPRDLLDALGGSSVGALRWSDGREIGATLQLEPGMGDPLWVRSERNPEADVEEFLCADRLTVPAQLTFTTLEDGLFAHMLVELGSTSVDRANFVAHLGADDSRTFLRASGDAHAVEAAVVFVHGHVATAGSSGSIQAADAPSEPYDFEIATWETAR